MTGATTKKSKKSKAAEVSGTAGVLARISPLNLDEQPVPSGEMAHLFTLDDVDYMVPLHPSAGVALEYIERRAANPSAANVWIMRELIGAEGYEALKGWKGLTGDILGQVIDNVVGLVLGAMEETTTDPLGRG